MSAGCGACGSGSGGAVVRAVGGTVNVKVVASRTVTANRPRYSIWLPPPIDTTSLLEKPCGWAVVTVTTGPLRETAAMSTFPAGRRMPTGVAVIVAPVALVTAGGGTGVNVKVVMLTTVMKKVPSNWS